VNDAPSAFSAEAADPSPAMGSLQAKHHGPGHDYEPGSPHLRHARLRSQLIEHIRQLVAEQFERVGRCRVLEIGAGHGSFTDHIAAMGAQVTVTEMSKPSLDVMRKRYAWNPGVRLVHDPDGQAALDESATYDLVLCISVLHHIPDYLSFIEGLTMRIEEGGSFASFQDPLWYSRRKRLNLAADRAAYYTWRLGQGDLMQGLSTRVRRARGMYDEAKIADMVEYHVVRKGVDEEQLFKALTAHFESVLPWQYWSTQSPLLQHVGARLHLVSTFGILCRGKLGTSK
jgi:SAM-dependent methyltransferase